MIVKRPNKLRAARVDGTIDQRFFYNSKTLTLYNPAQKVYATEATADTVERMIDFAPRRRNPAPGSHLLYRNAFPLLIQDVTLAAVVGKTVIGGVMGEPCCSAGRVSISRSGLPRANEPSRAGMSSPRRTPPNGSASPPSLATGRVMLPWTMPGSTSCRPRGPARFVSSTRSNRRGPDTETDGGKP